ncbi:MAG: glutamate synthase subunit beta [Archangiaceae bacterium]|nr:glutamate synthase subunit beta [Archangiaceae bacterium]
MSKPTGFLEWQREDADDRPVRERLRDFREVPLPLHPDSAHRQAGRCMGCGVPFCHQGCPLGNVIPDFNAALYRGDHRRAYQVLASTNDFPEFTGRLCPAPCEAACVLAVNQEPVTIEAIEKEIIERAFAEGWVQPRAPAQRTGKRVAVVGSGPAGLAAAAQLNRRGHAVTVIERADAVGGLLRYGIPDFKLEKQVIDRRVRVLEAEGVVFRTGVDVGGSLSWDALFDDHDALVLAIGARRARELEVPGAQLRGVVQAMDFLESQNTAVRRGTEPALSADRRRVVILGGGDTGSDCLGTALRQGAVSVTQAELLPAPPEARAETNPWPQWPMIFRTSSSQEEGGERRFSRRTARLEGQQGVLEALVWTDEAGVEERVPVDLLIQAMGFTGPHTEALTAQLGVELDARGNVKTDAKFQTSVPGVYCGGDARRGASLIVWAISEGRELARQVDTFLSGRPSPLPTKGRDQPFGGR